MANAIDTGLPKMRIEESAAKRQAKIDVGKEIIVGVNAYQVDQEEDISTLEIDNVLVKENQIKSIKRIKKSRNTMAVNDALLALSNAAKSGEGNLLELSIEAAKQRATLGEISTAMENAFGRYKAKIRSISRN